MSRAPHRGIRTLVWIMILVLGVFKPISAQEGSQVWLAPLNTESFPNFNSVLEVRSPSGEFIHGIELEDVLIIEDDRRVPLTDLQEIRTGIQFVLAVSLGPAFDIRDSQGISRYEYLAQVLQDWAGARRGSTVDDLSLMITDGPEITHLTEVDRWSAALQNFETTGDETGPDFDLLTRAMDVAGDQTSNPGMSSAVLFVTSLPAQDVSVGLQSLSARAVQQGIRIYIWLVASGEQFTSPGAESLRLLAEQTGGELFAYSGQETIPSPEDYLNELRNSYLISYRSRIDSSGVHQVSAEVNLQGGRITSPVQEIEIEVLPPSIAFISPPREIERVPLNPESESPDLVPDSLILDLLVEFPDGFVRPINETKFIVDGSVIEINQSEPFDQITWDLNEYTTGGEHILLVMVEDSLGLINQTVETPITVSVGSENENLLRLVSENRILPGVILAAVSGAAVLLLLVLGGKLKPGILRELRRRRKQLSRSSQPAQVDQGTPNQARSTWINRLQWPRSPITTKPAAQFVPITDANSENSHPPLTIISDRVLIGKDENRVDQVLMDNSVEDVHATLVREDADTYRLFDAESTAGTWLNYTPVPGTGQVLEHGDIVHFGRLGFRFMLRTPKRVRKPVIRFEDSE